MPTTPSVLKPLRLCNVDFLPFYLGFGHFRHLAAAPADDGGVSMCRNHGWPVNAERGPRGCLCSKQWRLLPRQEEQVTGTLGCCSLSGDLSEGGDDPVKDPGRGMAVPLKPFGGVVTKL